MSQDRQVEIIKKTYTFSNKELGGRNWIFYKPMQINKIRD